MSRTATGVLCPFDPFGSLENGLKFGSEGPKLLRFQQGVSQLNWYGGSFAKLRGYKHGDPAPWKQAIEVLVIRPSKGWAMKRRFSDEQIIGMIKEYEAGVKAQELCRKYGISDATFYIYGCLSRCKVSSALI